VGLQPLVHAATPLMMVSPDSGQRVGNLSGFQLLESLSFGVNSGKQCCYSVPQVALQPLQLELELMPLQLVCWLLDGAAFPLLVVMLDPTENVTLVLLQCSPRSPPQSYSQPPLCPLNRKPPGLKDR
jgi:hypothetical protein